MFDEDGNIEDLDFNLCIKCQELTSEPLVNNPSSLNKLLTSIEECSKYGDGPSVIRKRQIEQFKLRFPNLPSETSYHLSCYKNTTHKKTLDTLTKKHFQRQSNAGVPDNEPQTSEGPQHFTRSQTVPHKKEMFFLLRTGLFRFKTQRPKK